MYEDIERQIEKATPLTEEVLDKIERKTTDFGNEIKAGDKLLSAMYMSQYIVGDPDSTESNNINPRIHMAIFKFVESEFPIFKEKFPRFIIKREGNMFEYTYSMEDLYQKYIKDGGPSMEDILKFEKIKKQNPNSC